MDWSFVETRHVEMQIVGAWPGIFAGHVDPKDNKFTSPDSLLRVFDPRSRLILNTVYHHGGRRISRLLYTQANSQMKACE